MRQERPHMEVNWTGIICLVLAIVAVVIIAKAHGHIGAFLAAMGRIGPGHTTDDKVIGVIAFGLVALLIVAIVKILVSQRR